MRNPKPHLLIVDDSLHDCESYKRALHSHYHLMFSRTGEEALAKYDQCRPDLILLDYQLPDMTGLDFLNTYAKDSNSRTPSIVITGQGDQQVAVKIMQSGASDYMVKDAGGRYLKRLPTKVRGVLNKHKKQLELLESRELRDIILRMAGEGIVGLDESGKIIFANNAALSLMGSEDADTIGRPFGDFLDIADRDQLHIPLWLQPNDAMYRPPIQESEFKDSAGKRFTVEYTVTPFFNNILDQMGKIVVFQDISQRKDAENALLHMSTHDALTQLYNREFFLQTMDNTIAQAERSPRAFTIMFLDINNFKMVNDSFGHDFGDRLLKQVATRLTDSMRRGDVIARLGGDEFVLLLNELSDRDAVCAVAEKIISIISEPLILDGYEFNISTSVGVAQYPDNGVDTSTLLRAADLAMYNAKEAGQGKYALFDDSMLGRANTVANIERSLNDVDIAKEFEIYYEPQIDPNEANVVAMEALLRWNHPTEGLLTPDIFIPVMERSQLINQVGNWVISEACRQLRQWHEQLDNPALRIAINISTNQLLTPELTDSVRTALNANGLAPHNLELDITESRLAHISDDCIKTLNDLRELGVRIAVDDFGTGNASLRYLKTLPLTTLKIDKSFVDDLLSNPDDTAIIEGAVMLAQKLGLSVIAEGVENFQQSIRLRQLGVELLQGYFYQRPLTMDAATEYLLELRSHTVH